MATHSRILAWRITLTEEPGRLQSMGLQESDTTATKPPPPPCIRHHALSFNLKTFLRGKYYYRFLDEERMT